MKRLLLLLDAALAVLFIAVAAPKIGWLPAVLLVVLLGALMAPRTSHCYVATLILPRILQRMVAAYKTRLPLLKYFAFDVSPEKVKFEQEIIAQMPIVPTSTSHTPGADLTAGAQNVKDLISDIPMKIDQARKVVLKLPTADAVKLELDPVFDEAIRNAGYALAEGVVAAALGSFANSNFSHEIVETIANTDRDTLSKARQALNMQKAPAPRFGITSLDFMGALTADTRIASRDYHAKLVDDNPYVILENLEGFKQIAEFTGFPGDGAIGTFTAEADDDIITLPLHGLPEGAKIRVANSGGALPTGLAADTDYFVRDVTPDTFKVSATLGGAAINITGDGTGTQTATRYEHLNAVFFAANAVLIAIRQLNDNIDTARRLGIPVPLLQETHTDDETGLTFTAYMWIDVKTHDIYVAAVVAFGVRGGKQGSGGVADSLLDRSALRVVETASV